MSAPRIQKAASLRVLVSPFEYMCLHPMFFEEFDNDTPVNIVGTNSSRSTKLSHFRESYEIDRDQIILPQSLANDLGIIGEYLLLVFYQPAVVPETMTKAVFQRQ